MPCPSTGRTEETGGGQMTGTAAVPRRLRRRRLGAVALAVGIGLFGAPGTASAAPADPSDGQSGAVARAAEDAAAEVKRLLEQMGAAQSAADAATAQAARAQDEVEATRLAAQSARADAAQAAAEAQRAQADLSGAREALGRFARTSYMGGSTSPILESLLTSDGPAQMLERAALLDAAGQHRSTVLSGATEAQQRAAETEAAARGAVTESERLQAAAQSALGSAEAARATAIQVVADLRGQQAAAESELAQVRSTLVDLQAQRDAAQQASRSSSPPPVPAPEAGPTAGSPVRVRWELEHQHGQRLLRRPAVQLVHLARLRRCRARPAGRPRHAGAADRRRGEGARRPGPGRVAHLRSQPLTAGRRRSIAAPQRW
jgi:hypothetical protein